MTPAAFRTNLWRDDRSGCRDDRRGSFFVMALFCLTACLVFVAFAVDIGLISVTQQRMQNAVDAASLAAAMELTYAIENAGPEVENVTVYAQEQAAAKAVEVAAMNDVFVDPNSDVIFGRRVYDASSNTYSTSWNSSPSNVIKVVARKDNEDLSAPDGQLPLAFARIFGKDSAIVRASAAAYVEPRDIVAVHDFSGSMSFSSQFKAESITNLGQEAIENNLSEIFTSLSPVDVGNMVFTPDYMTMPNEMRDNDDPVIDVTFMYDEVLVESDTPYDEVRLIFTDNVEESISTNGANTGSYSGSGTNAGKDIATAWVVVLQGVTVAGTGTNPFIEVTFTPDGTCVYIESTKDLSNVVLEYDDGVHQKFDNLNIGQTGTFCGTGDNTGKQIAGLWVKSGSNASGDGPGYGERFDAPEETTEALAYEFRDTNENVLTVFGLNDVAYPYPAGSWDQYISYVRTDTDVNRAGYREMYGGMTFAHYLLEIQPRANQTPDLWKTPHYPFHAVKMGTSHLADYLADLGFGDFLGSVSYDTYHRVEDYLNDGTTIIDISSTPITSNYDAVDTIMQHKQAAHYASSTNIGGGIWEAHQLLMDYGRDEARPTMLLMTDGVPTAYGAYTVPSDWSWDELFDYNNDGIADYQLYGSEYDYQAKMYALVMAKAAADDGVTIHTLTVGDGADEALMQAIAHLGNGASTHVPSTVNVADLEGAIGDALQQLSAFVPPPILLNDVE